MHIIHQIPETMEETLRYTIIMSFFLILAINFITKQRHKNSPPTPLSIPIIGHLHLLKKPLHQTLHKFSQKYGPIFSLRFGSRLAVIISSPAAVEECFIKKDIEFANRPHFLLGKYVNYNTTTLDASNYGDHWRNLRRICTVEILSSNRLNQFSSIRKDEVNLLLRRLHRISCHGYYAKVELRSMFFDLTTNIIMRMVAGKRYRGEDVKEKAEARQFREILEEFFECTGLTHIGDLFPILEKFDYNGYIKKVVRLSKKTDSFMQKLIDEHRVHGDRNTMINHLLAMQNLQPDYYSDEIIKGLILIMLVAGSETTAVALEWAIANLINNPNVLKKAKAELDSKIGEDRLIDESDIPKLNYLQSVIYENLRLYPVAPIIVPHLSAHDCTIGGFNVPHNTMVLANAWAIQRDPNLWEDPTEFKPERYGDGKVDEGFKLLPFGVGRRCCPGEGLAMREMGLTLGSLIQYFEWERVGGEMIDMTSKTTITMCKVEPLEVLCRACPVLDKLLS